MALIDDIVSYWKLDTNNSTQPDELGNYPGTVSGALYTASGKINGGYDFNGTSDKITIGDASSEFTTEATLNMWVKLDSATPTRYETGLCIFNVASTPTHYPYTNGSFYTAIFRNLRLGPITLSGSVTLTDWHMFTITTTPGANGYKFYQNANLVYQTTGNATVSMDTSSIIGASNASYFFNGLIDEVSLFSAAKSSDEILELYNSGDGLQYPFVAGGTLAPIISTKGIHSAMYGGGICNG